MSVRGGVCAACGCLVQQHYNVRNLWIGCLGARRVNEALQASPVQPHQVHREFQILTGGLERDGGVR